MEPLYEKDGKVYLYVRVTPKAAKNAFEGGGSDVFGQKYLKVRLQAIPENGKANKACVDFIAKSTSIPKSLISLVRGQKKREKLLEISLSFNEAWHYLEPILKL